MGYDNNDLGQEGRHYIEGYIHPELLSFVEDPKTQEFVAKFFKPGQVKIQKGIGEPVSIEYQDKLLKLIPWV
ncbi:MAG: hypothetical protein AAB953_01505, partial [Patescibacteria group bacterium]